MGPNGYYFPENTTTILLSMINLREQTHNYLTIMRFDRPVGTLLILWPTLWALWLAAEGLPDTNLLIIFTLGTFFMRSAGCVINDYADRNIDGSVERTNNRPLVTGQVSAKEALILCAVLCLLSFLLVLLTNATTIMLSFVAMALAACYPFMKRHTYFPQVVLGAAFACGTLMAFSAQTGELPLQVWPLYLATVLWTVVFDTFYAMVDRDDDIKIGIKSTAILFGINDKRITGLLQGLVIFILLISGNQFHLGYYYYGGVAIATGLFIYQQRLIRNNDRERCFKAFINNQWVGAAIFVGIYLHFLLN